MDDKKEFSLWSIVGGIIVIIGILAFFSAGYGYQWGWWDLGFAFGRMLPGGTIITGAGFLVTLVGLIISIYKYMPKCIVMSILALLIAASQISFAFYWRQEARKYPPIHDITTDFEKPPAFNILLDEREEYPNPSEYGGMDVARQQKEHYPDIGPLFLDTSPREAFDLAFDAARQMGWKIASANETEGWIEATDKVPWFGFKDDVVVRIDTAGGQTRIDVRSVSRIGRGDIGVNAERIRDYFETIRSLNESE